MMRSVFPYLLKTMHLEDILYPNEDTFERLVSSRPVLEELNIFGCWNDNPKVFRVLSRSLKTLTIEIRKSMHAYCPGVLIDAPPLSVLSINDRLSQSFVINIMHSDAKLDISLSFGLDNFDEAGVSLSSRSIRSFLPEISKVGDMTIYRDTFKIICQYSKLEPLPQLGCISRMFVKLWESDFKWLPTFLESCPNLKSLILVCYIKYEEMNEISMSYVPHCLPSSLEFVDFNVPIRGYAEEMKLVRYFLENSAILKKLTLY